MYNISVIQVLNKFDGVFSNISQKQFETPKGGCGNGNEMYT